MCNTREYVQRRGNTLCGKTRRSDWGSSAIWINFRIRFDQGLVRRVDEKKQRGHRVKRWVRFLFDFDTATAKSDLPPVWSSSSCCTGWSNQRPCRYKQSQLGIRTENARKWSQTNRSTLLLYQCQRRPALSTCKTFWSVRMVRSGR